MASMSNHHSAYFLGLFSAVLFSGASVVFARFSSSHSSQWMNFMKNSVAGLAFCVATLIAILFGQEALSHVTQSSYLYLLGSGFIGLAVGDYFLFRGYQRIGSARTIMVFSFSPLFLTIEGFLFFGQGLATHQLVALICMMACVWTISFEKFREKGEWEWKGIAFAAIGVFLDNIGVVLSRKAFDHSPEMGSFLANAIRAMGAVIPFYLVLCLRRETPIKEFLVLNLKDKCTVIFAAFMGTFLSLFLWLTALRIGHIGSLAGVGSFNPVAASLWEWALLRKKPTKYLIVALALFLSGFSILLFGG